jgi:hypothetical protein
LNTQLSVIIDEYDGSINVALGRPSFASALRVGEDRGQDKLKQIENRYAEFFSRLKQRVTRVRGAS